MAAVVVDDSARAHAETGVPVSAAAFNPNGDRLYIGGDRRVNISSLTGESPLLNIPVDFPRIHTVAMHAGGRWLAVGGGFPGELGSVQFVDTTTKNTGVLIDDHGDLVTSTAWRPKSVSAECAAASADGSVSIYSWGMRFLPVRPKQRLILTNHAGAVTAVSYDPSGQFLVSVGADRSVKVWNAETGELIRSLNHHTDRIHAIAFRPGAVPAECATGGDDGTIRVWQPTVGRMLRIIRNPGGSTLALSYTRDGASIFGAGHDGVLRKWDADSNQLIGEWSGHNDWVYSLAVSPDGKLLASGGWSGTVKLWDVSAVPESPLKQLPFEP